MPTILCIDDEVYIRQIIAEELEDAGYDTLQAEDGRKGLEKILEYKPDMVICDINMPGMSGFELFNELSKNHNKYVDIPFIFLSAQAGKQDVLKGIKIGVNDYLTKPIDFDFLLAKVSGCLVREGHKCESEMKRFENLELLD